MDELKRLANHSDFPVASAAAVAASDVRALGVRDRTRAVRKVVASGDLTLMTPNVASGDLTPFAFAP